MKKAHLARKLSQVEDFDSPRVSLEQYLTPPSLAADLIFTAYMQQDIEGKEVLDLGTGTGILGIGAALMGGNVTAVEKDSDALEIARENAEELDAEINFVESDVADFNEEADTVVMNPPFSVHSDIGMKFVEKAANLADSVYMIANRGSREAIKDFVRNSSHDIKAVQEYTIGLPPTFGFHTEESRETPVDLIITKEDTQ